jgi:mannose/fructose-specific phosphotransferase system component IIA
MFWVAVMGVLTCVAIPMIRAALKAHRANKDLDDILADAIEAGLDEFEKKKRKKK